MKKVHLLLGLLAFASTVFAAPPEATAYHITVDHAGATTAGGALALQLNPRWTVTLSSAGGYPLIAANRVYELAGGLLYAFDVQTGAKVWGPTQVANGIGATYDNDKVFVVSNNGLLSSFNATTGTPGWTNQLPGQYSFSSAPTASNGIVYVGGAGSGGTLYAVNESDGTLAWTAGVANGDNSSPAVGPNAVYVSYACQNTYSFNLTTGVRNWLNPTVCEGGGGETPVYASGKLYALDSATGNDIFDAATGSILGSFTSTTVPAVDASTAYYLNGSTLSAVDVASSVLRWTFTGDGGLTTAPIVVDQTVIVGSAAGTLFGLDEQSGRLTWQADSGLAIPNGTVWFSIYNGLAIGDGVLVVPGGTQLVAYSILGPPAPTNVTATSASGGAHVSWTAAAGATAYNVYVATQSGAEPFAASVSGVAGTTALVPGLDPGTTYYFTVKATGPQGISAASNEASVIPSQVAAPTLLVATAGIGAVQLKWAKSSNATSYNVYVGTAAGGEASTPTLTSITALNATVFGLVPGTNYYFEVRGIANGIASLPSNEASADPLAAAAPTMLIASAQVGGAALSWNAASGATSYQVFVGTTPGGESPAPAQSGINSTATTLSPLLAGQGYYFVVCSVTNGVRSGPSNEVTVVPSSYPGPQNVVLTPGVGQMQVSWSASPGATQYDVFIGTSPGGESATPAQTVQGLLAIITGLTGDTTYYIKVRAQTPIGPSTYSLEVAAVALPPAGPSNLAATPGTNQISLTWSAAAGATTYDVYEATSIGGESATPIQTGISGLSTIVSGLTAGTKYYFVVRAETANGLSATSNEASAVPAAPSSGGSSGGGGGGGALYLLDLVGLALFAMLRHATRERFAH